MHRTKFCPPQKGTDAKTTLVGDLHCWAGIIDLTVHHRLDPCTAHFDPSQATRRPAGFFLFRLFSKNYGYQISFTCPFKSDFQCWIRWNRRTY